MKLKEHYIGFEVYGRQGFDRVRFAIMGTCGATASGLIVRWENDEPIYTVSITGELSSSDWRLPLVAAESAAMAFDKYRIIDVGRPWIKLPPYELSSSEFAQRKHAAGI